jgi:hypothetical protein
LCTVYQVFIDNPSKQISFKTSRIDFLKPECLVKKRCIHDNFMLVQGLLKEFNRNKTSALFIKLDIVKAFDSVSWAYLLEVLERLSFGLKWRDWISLALCTATSRVLLNGALSKPIKHERSLRQGDLISPMLFILAMDPLQWILHLATEKGIMHPISTRARGITTSLYADDAIIFVALTKRVIKALRAILDIFGQTTGLCTNVLKLEVFPIRCSGLQLDQILDRFPAPLREFPYHYLGLPLHPKKLRKIDFLPLIEKVGDKLLSCKEKLMSKAARAQLVNSDLMTVVTYHATIFNLPKWLTKKIDKIQRNFYWKGEDTQGNRGGVCLVK